jgi:uncharacterized protein YndB with AHSA1/START domain
VSDEVQGVVSVSRRIDASASTIFGILADPARHPEIDGSGSVQTGGDSAVISAVGDVFVMKMHFPHLGDYEMNNLVVEYEPDRRITWEPAPGRGHPRANDDDPTAERLGHRWSYSLTPEGSEATTVTETYDCRRAPEEFQVGMNYGRQWLEAMDATLERLEQLCTS